MTQLARPILTKSKYLYGLQCLKQLWWRAHEPKAPELLVDPVQQRIFDQGTLVGELARERFPGGILMDYLPWQYEERCEATRVAMAAGSHAIYEASFQENGVFVAVDVLERYGSDWCLIEVKSTTDAKVQHLPDVAVQLHVLQAAGLQVAKAEVMHLNRDCRAPDLSNLFRREDVTAEARALQADIPRQIQRMSEALAGGLPEVAIGDHCSAPYDCPFRSRCCPQLPEHHVSTLYSLGKKAMSLVAQGIETIHDLPDDFNLSTIAARQVRSVKSNQLVVEPGLRVTLAALKTPIAFLDFETIAPPVPVWNGCAPYEAVAVQMSCHVLDAQGQLTHDEYLAEGAVDPRPAMAEAILRSCHGAHTVLAYNAAFEKGCIERMAAAVPSRRAALLDVAARLVDLLPIVRNHVYHPAFGGSFSLKSVLPALVPDLGYDDLEIGEGMTAQAVLEKLLLQKDKLAPEECQKLREHLLAYCKRDTFAMVKLVEVLTNLQSALDMNPGTRANPLK